MQWVLDKCYLVASHAMRYLTIHIAPLETLLSLIEVLFLFVSEPAKYYGQRVPSSVVRGEKVRAIKHHSHLLSRELHASKSVSDRSNFASTCTKATPFPNLIPFAAILLARLKFLSGHRLYACLPTSGTRAYQDWEKRDHLERWGGIERPTFACSVSSGSGAAETLRWKVVEPLNECRTTSFRTNQGGGHRGRALAGSVKAHLSTGHPYFTARVNSDTAVHQPSTTIWKQNK